MVVILIKIKDFLGVLLVCEIWFGYFNKMEKVKEIFR